MFNNFNIDDVEILVNDEADDYVSECEAIFDENGQGHILNRDGISNRDLYNLIVAVYKGRVVAYQLLYIGGDFVKSEGFIEQYINRGLEFEEDAVYLWDMCTKKCFEGHGIQRKMFALTKDLYPYQNFYTITDSEVKNSLALQQSVGFNVLEDCSFYGDWNGEVCYFHILRKPALRKMAEPEIAKCEDVKDCGKEVM